MKALTIWQPWASLIMIGAKPFEFRPWDFRTRERCLAGRRIVIHAGARPVKPAEIEDLLARLGTGEDATGLVVAPARKLLERIHASYKCQGVVELAAGLGTVIIGTPRNAGTIFGRSIADSDRGDFNWAWPLSDNRPFDAPVPMRGAQGFWNWPEAIAA